MPKRVITNNDIEVILDIVQRNPEGISQKDLAVALTPRVPERTLQLRIKNLVDVGKLVKSGKSRRTTSKLELAGLWCTVWNAANSASSGEQWEGVPPHSGQQMLKICGSLKRSK